MKGCVTILLLFILVIQCFTRWAVVLDYQWNRQYIAARLCENRSRPQLHCNGKCQLAKKLAAEEKQSQQTGGKIRSTEVLSSRHAFISGWQPIVSVIKKVRHDAPKRMMTQHLQPVFQPPDLLWLV